ncbi:MAG: DUF1684 domain-containing protein [Candidatus Neomarinimicrobiota bacterium]
MNISVTGVLLLTACASTPPLPDMSYENEIKAWHQARIERLRQPDSWLTLAGLFWLAEGENSFGAAADNDIVFPAGKAPDYLGTFDLAGDSIQFKTADDVAVTSRGLKITGTIHLVSDADGEPTILEWGSLNWHIIKRGERYGVRLKDNRHPQLKAFKGIEMFPISADWRIAARLEPYDPPRQIAIPNVLGQIEDSPCPGALVFEIAGRTCRLDPIAAPGDEQYFVIFADATSGKETYGAGRFLSVVAPGPDGSTWIDFNQAYNPPCAFSDFATCPLPPRQNVLPVAITAGEKRYGSH